MTTKEEVLQKQLRRLYSIKKARSKSRKIGFYLTEELFYKLSLMNCHYCGNPPSNQLKTNHGVLKYSGIDRLDSSAGYVEQNVVPCCSFCNSMKGAMPFNRWASFINRLVTHNGGSAPYPNARDMKRGKGFWRGR